MENLASILKDSIMELVDNINNNPVLVTRLGNLVAKSGFNWSFMKAIICGLKEEWLMDKAIQMIVDTWDEYNDRDDERCKQSAGSYSYYDGDQYGIYEVKQSLSIPKYFNLKRELEGVKADELERRKVNEKFNKMMVPSVEQEEEPQFTYTDDTFKKSAMITDMQLDLMLAELIVNGWMPNDSSKSDFYKLFSGAKSEFTLTWSGKPGELHDFFDMLTKKKVGKRKKTDGYVTPRGNYLNIACSHFKNKRGKWFKNLKGQKHTDGTKDVLNLLEITLTYSVDQCVKMMRTIIEEHKDLLENLNLSVKPEHHSNYGRSKKGTT